MSFTSTERECISVERINQYLNSPKENLYEIKSKSKIVHMSKPNETKQIIEFKNVWLKYDQTSTNYALKNISFSIDEHQKVAFCGRTGCGKTSILNSLFRLYEIDKGDIYFMGDKIDTLPLTDLRTKIVKFII